MAMRYEALCYLYGGNRSEYNIVPALKKVYNRVGETFPYRGINHICPGEFPFMPVISHPYSQCPLFHFPKCPGLDDEVYGHPTEVPSSFIFIEYCQVEFCVRPRGENKRQANFVCSCCLPPSFRGRDVYKGIG